MSRGLSPTKILADATPLNQAVFGFGDARDQDAHGRASAALLLAQRRLRSEGYSPELFAFVEEKRTALETIEHRMEDRLRQRLTRQELVAVGQRVEAGARSEFEVIPARFWEHAAITPARCEAKAGGDRYAPVYVAFLQERHYEAPAEASVGGEQRSAQACARQASSDLSRPEAEPQAATDGGAPTRGRPKKRPYADRGVRMALEDHPNLREMKQCDAIEIVQDTLRKQTDFVIPRDLFPGERTIRRSIKDLCEGKS